MLRSIIMSIRATILRETAAIAVGSVLAASTVAAPIAAASPLESMRGTHDLESVNKKKDQKDAEKHSGGGGLSDLPIVGDVVGGFKDAEPVDVAVNVIQFAAGAAETVVPLITQGLK
jgi:hypothetical protein